MAAEIYVCTENRSKVYKLPFLPESLPEFSRGANNEEFETFDNGTFNILGNVGLIEFTLEGVLPAYPTKYSFSQSNVKASVIIDFFKTSMSTKKPIRVVINRSRNSQAPPQFINILTSIESMTWSEDKVGDTVYSVSFKEYRKYV